MSTIGGNLVNASPIGDFSILLLALNSNITLENMGVKRTLPLNQFFKTYKQIDMQQDEILEKISFEIPGESTIFHFEKVSQRNYFDIASVNMASNIAFKNDIIESAHFAVGGVAAIPMYLFRTSAYLRGKPMEEYIIDEAIEILNEEISPISDARGSAGYKRLLARQLLIAQFLNIDKNLYNIKKLVAL